MPDDVIKVNPVDAQNFVQTLLRSKPLRGYLPIVAGAGVVINRRRVIAYFRQVADLLEQDTNEGIEAQRR